MPNYPWNRFFVPLLVLWGGILIVRVVGRWALPLMLVGAAVFVLFNAGSIITSLRAALG